LRHFLIDTDTASDDAAALAMALRHPGVRVEAITVVAGNVPLEIGLQNALYTVERCGAGVPVYAGIAGPTLRPLQTAQFCHGKDGFGDIGLPLRRREPANGHAVDAILETATRLRGNLTPVTLGPLTNVATALLRYPGLAREIERCVIMGGIGCSYGSIVPVAEYNIWVEPDAAKIVSSLGCRSSWSAGTCRTTTRASVPRMRPGCRPSPTSPRSVLASRKACARLAGAI
jgi:purine nucleosidase